MTNNAAIPAELAAAVQRVRDGVGRVKRAVKPADAVLGTSSVPNAFTSAAIQGNPSASGVASSQQALTTGWCNTTWFSQYDSGYGDYLSQCASSYWNWTVCWNNVTGSGWASHGDANRAKMNVCPYTGNITYTVTADESWVPQGTWTVNENSYRWVTAYDSGCDEFPYFNDCPYVKAAVTNASGDGYNYRFIIHDN